MRLQKVMVPSQEMPPWEKSPFECDFEYAFEGNELLKHQNQRESNARSYPRRIPIALEKGKGVYVRDTEGRIFIDCLAGAGALVLGHHHPVLIEAITQIVASGLPLQTLDLTTPIKDRFIRDLFEILPSPFAAQAKIHFCGPSGSDAIEAALKLARTATGRSGVIAFSGAYHGMSLGAMSLMGNLVPKTPLAALASNVQFLPFPYDYRCPFGLGGAEGERANLSLVENLLSDPESGVPKPAAIVLEVVQGEGGVIPASSSWLVGIRQIATRCQIPLIIDEVQTGLGRTGHLFAFEESRIVPDILVLSKAIGGGLPLAVIVYDSSLDHWAPGAHAGTFRGNQMAMATGSAAIRYVRDNRLYLHAREMGQKLQDTFKTFQNIYPQLGDIRGRGLMIGIEIVDPEGPTDRLGHPPPAPDLAASIQMECLKRGLIIEVGGRYGSVLRFLPPLIIEAQEIETTAAIFERAIKKSTTHRG